jgi:CHASE2 domain-containing sensor protein
MNRYPIILIGCGLALLQVGICYILFTKDTLTGYVFIGLGILAIIITSLLWHQEKIEDKTSKTWRSYN